MEYEENDGNPWATFSIKARSPQKFSSKIIDNRFPNNFKRTSSIVTCNICQVLLLQSQTLHHFKALHNKKLTKKCSKFIIPYNAVEVYDLICEHKSQKMLLSKKSNSSSKCNEIIQVKRPKLEVINNINSKETLKAMVKLQKPIIQLNKLIQPNGVIKKEKEIKKENLENEKIPLDQEPDLKILDCRLNSEIVLVENKVTLNPEIDGNSVNNDLKLNIRVNSNGILTSSMKTESNIFDRMSTICENTLNQKPNISGNITNKGAIKQTGFDKSYGCTIFTDKHNNSILIDNDKDELEDFDCCESSISNDSAYYSLPNTAALNSLATQHLRKSANFYDSSIVPPLVTAYQFSSSTNTISYNKSDSEIQKRLKSSSSSSTMVVTRNSTKNSTFSTKSNVKHRFYVSSHSNQNILDSIRKNSNLNKINSSGLLKESGEYSSDLRLSGILHNIQSDNLNFDCNLPSEMNCQLNITSLSENDRDVSINSMTTYDNSVINGCSRPNIRQLLSKNIVWNCIHEEGIKSHLLIPKRLCWNYIKSRCKTIPHLYTKKSKYSNDVMLQFNSVPPLKNISDNPLLSSYTIDSNESDSYLQSNVNNTSEILLDYPFPDRNQMSFQQRLLERGVISQRDITRSQRCLSLNNHNVIRKNAKSNSNKPMFIDNKRILTNKTCSFKNQIVSQVGNEVGGCHNMINKINYTYIDPMVKDNHKNRSTIILDNNYDIMPNPMLNNQRKSWLDTNKLSRVPNVNANITTFQGLCLSQNNKFNKPNGTIVIGSNSSYNTVLSHMDNKSENILSSYKFQSDTPVLQFSNTTSNSGGSAQNMLPNDTISFSQPLTRKYINHSISHGNNRCNCCSQNFANHSTNVIHTNFDR